MTCGRTVFMRRTTPWVYVVPPYALLGVLVSGHVTASSFAPLVIRGEHGGVVQWLFCAAFVVVHLAMLWMTLTAFVRVRADGSVDIRLLRWSLNRKWNGRVEDIDALGVIRYRDGQEEPDDVYVDVRPLQRLLLGTWSQSQIERFARALGKPVPEPYSSPPPLPESRQPITTTAGGVQ